MKFSNKALHFFPLNWVDKMRKIGNENKNTKLSQIFFFYNSTFNNEAIIIIYILSSHFSYALYHKGLKTQIFFFIFPLFYHLITSMSSYKHRIKIKFGTKEKLLKMNEVFDSRTNL